MVECLSLGGNCYMTPFSKLFLGLSGVIQLTSNIVFWLYSRNVTGPIFLH